VCVNVCAFVCMREEVCGLKILARES